MFQKSFQVPRIIGGQEVEQLGDHGFTIIAYNIAYVDHSYAVICLHLLILFQSNT